MRDLNGPLPHTVAIVAMGGSSMDYIGLASQHGGRHALADETWAINAMGGVIHHDRLFAMDDISALVAQRRGEGRKVATGMLDWLEEHPGPVYVPREYSHIPGSVEYPVEDVLNAVGFPYLNNTVAYTLAFALYLNHEYGQPSKVKMYGCDFTYPNKSVAEAGRANVEWLMGIAGERDIHIEVSNSTTLMDAHQPLNKRLYGYGEPVVPQMTEEGRWVVRFPEREKVAQKNGGPPEAPSGEVAEIKNRLEGLEAQVAEAQESGA